MRRNKFSRDQNPANDSRTTVQTSVFPQTLHSLRPNLETAAKTKKRDNIFSKSRDTREDRGTREMKTAHNHQTNHMR